MHTPKRVPFHVRLPDGGSLILWFSIGYVPSKTYLKCAPYFCEPCPKQFKQISRELVLYRIEPWNNNSEIRYPWQSQSSRPLYPHG